VVENGHAADVFQEFMHLFHEMDKDTEEEGMGGVRLYYFMGFPMRDMPGCIVDIFDSIRFQLFNFRNMICSSIPGVRSGIVKRIWEFYKFIRGGDADSAAVGDYPVDHNILQVVC